MNESNHDDAASDASGSNPVNREDLVSEYLDLLPFEPYPVQEEALLSWFSSEQGTLVCAPTGTGKTLIAEAALYEALRTGKRAYYTTPLIALTEQKLKELQASAERWGFSADSVGLVTGNRRVNPDAPILVVVAEILFNRLLRENADFADVSAVVMDEFHSFNDPERGIVWEFSLGLLPKHVRLLLISATVGNSNEFMHWLRRANERTLELVQSDDRKVPLTFSWVGDELLNDHLEKMAQGDDESRYTPALVFCFNRDECWNVAEQLKGKKLVGDEQKKRLIEELEQHNWSGGAGPKLKQVLMRGVGVHHAGLLPRYKRIVERLFQQKLLSITVCTETLAAGINLPARSVVLPSLMKGPPTKKKVVEPSAAHQMFGRAGRPQFDDQGYVFALAHEDDVKILRWREKYDQIPEDTKDPQLRKAKKALKKKMPTRRQGQAYWTETQFEQLRDAPSGKLESKGEIPWRLLAFMLDVCPDVKPIRELVAKRLMLPKQLEQAQRQLDRMLMTLYTAGYVTLEPKPPLSAHATVKGNSSNKANADKKSSDDQASASVAEPESKPAKTGLFGELLNEMNAPKDDPKSNKTKQDDKGTAGSSGKGNGANDSAEDAEAESYRALRAVPTETLERLLLLRGVNPLFGLFVVNQLGIADRAERIQAFESILEMPGSVARYVRVPKREELPPGPLATTRLDVQLLQLGLATPEELGVESDEEEDDGYQMFAEDKVWPLHLADKLRRLFQHDFPQVRVRITPVWVAGELLEFGGDFEKYISTKRLQKQEGIIFRHLLRLILLLNEFITINPPDVEPAEWQAELKEIRDGIVDCCRRVDPTSVDEVIEQSEGDGKSKKPTY